MTSIRLALTLIATLVATACLPVTSKIPVGSTVGFKPDRNLLGVWKGRGQDDEAPSYIHFLGKDDGGMVALIVSPPHKENLGEWSQYNLRAVTLNGNHYVNAQEVSNDGEASKGPLADRNVLLLYRTDKRGKVILYMMDEKAVAAAIKAGEIAGDVEPGQDGDVHITADGTALDAFMRTPKAAALFSKPLVTLTRVE